MVDYAMIAGVVVPLFGAMVVDQVAKVMQKRLPHKYKTGAKHVSLLSMFILVAYGISDTAIVIHQAGAPSIFFVAPFAVLTYIYWRHFSLNLSKIRAKTWRLWYMYIFGVSCFALAPIGYFLLMYSVLELRYNILPSL